MHWEEIVFVKYRFDTFKLNALICFDWLFVVATGSLHPKFLQSNPRYTTSCIDRSTKMQEDLVCEHWREL